MCTHIIDFQDRKLKSFKGEKGRCLTQFVAKYPEKKAYFELGNETMKFVFPEPGPMEGVKSRSKTILRMNSVSFTYPTKDKPTIVDVNLTVSQVVLNVHIHLPRDMSRRNCCRLVRLVQILLSLTADPEPLLSPSRTNTVHLGKNVVSTSSG
jgi:hypothetical protein